MVHEKKNVIYILDNIHIFEGLNLVIWSVLKQNKTKLFFSLDYFVCWDLRALDKCSINEIFDHFESNQ